MTGQSIADAHHELERLYEGATELKESLAGLLEETRTTLERIFDEKNTKKNADRGGKGNFDPNQVIVDEAAFAAIRKAQSVLNVVVMAAQDNSRKNK